ncbi:hypothetical protein J7M22_09450 [Candidatus Poribacteria bacterium]|nr:hypothetical protein [Candidatus Poribacteria bacterium]
MIHPVSKLQLENGEAIASLLENSAIVVLDKTVWGLLLEGGGNPNGGVRDDQMDVYRYGAFIDTADLHRMRYR